MKEFLNGASELVCHNIIGFDLGVLDFFNVLSAKEIKEKNIRITDTLVISKLLNYRQEGGHSLERWGNYFKYPKDTFSDFSKWSQDLEDRCITDTKINSLLFNLFSRYLNSPDWKESIQLEHNTAYLCQELQKNGFPFDVGRATEALEELSGRVGTLEAKFASVFPPKTSLIREITPVLTQKGTLNAKDFRWVQDGDLSVYREGSTFSLYETIPFNPRSSKQRIEVLNKAGWKPENKTKGHIEAERNNDKKALEHFKVYGWKCDEDNLATLPPDAPEAAKLLAEFLLYSSRLEDLEEWIGLYNSETGCIHGTFSAIGSWTHRKSHQRPNMANIPALINRKGAKQPYGEEFRSYWKAREGYVLVGCDAEGIQLRVFAHYCNDPKLISGIVSGDKKKGTDIHTVNMGILNRGINDIESYLCKSREAAKTYIYALFLGAASRKQSEILECKTKDAAAGLERILDFYPGWKKLKNERIPKDAANGYFVGLDGRKVMFPSAHHILAGYLQNGESVIMKKACLLWHEELRKQGIPFIFRNDVHDEWQTETLPQYAEAVGKIQEQSIVDAGIHFNLNCALAGKSVIGANWAITH